MTYLVCLIKHVLNGWLEMSGDTNEIDSREENVRDR